MISTTRILHRSDHYFAGLSGRPATALGIPADCPTAKSPRPGYLLAIHCKLRFRINVLPGDVNSNGAVTTADVGLTRSRVGNTIGDAGYDKPIDVNANGAITTADVGFVRSRVGTVLPGPEPTSASPSRAADAAFEALALRERARRPVLKRQSLPSVDYVLAGVSGASIHSGSSCGVVSFFSKDTAESASRPSPTDSRLRRKQRRRQTSCRRRRRTSRSR